MVADKTAAPDPITNPLGHRIYSLMSEIGWDYREAADAAETTHTALNNLVTGKTRTPNIWLLARLAAALGTTLEDLLERLGVLDGNKALAGVEPGLVAAVRGTTPEFQRSLARHVGFLKSEGVYPLDGGEGGTRTHTPEGTGS